MKQLLGGLMVAAMLPGIAFAGEAGDALVAHLYAGTAADGVEAASLGCAAGDTEACFAEGMLGLVLAYEGLAQDLYRHGATLPGNSAAALFFGLGMEEDPVPANPNPKPLTYEALRQVLDDFVTDADAAKAKFELAAAAGDYVISIDPLKVRIDLNGDGMAEADETLAILLDSGDDMMGMSFDELAPSTGKTKGQPQAPDTTVGFDRADAYWLAGYLTVAATPFDLILAHDFSDFYAAYMHRIFPRSGLPMQAATPGGMLFLDAESDSGIADLIAGIHTLRFPVVDTQRLASVLIRLKAVTALSRQNWQAIMAETDDDRELLPSPSQTSIIPGMTVTQETVDAWIATLDTLDEIFEGELLVPHWRFAQGFDLKAYFETATETDLVLLISGSAALPYIKPGPIADAQSFAAANEAFGADWLNYAFWFN
ncbi:hypothetical protein SAMN05428969_1523 [Devosia sp. YR412]|uniref:hypothetical protein n=1 Tax=Devosia sp. YR412 TaxID=1881030 RepID=UPI0008C010EB|nr:hypothetical protein [Devosia sp. YR412]SEQ00951.1 hypothetical protein SAMN05428969_1523 [Devosia sp. YR412]